MQRKQGALTYLAVLIVVGLVTGALFSHAHAQTVLSPTPIMPIQDHVNTVVWDIPAVMDPANKEPAESLVDEKLFYIPLIINDCVENQIEFFTTRGRTIFQSWLDRSARYLPTMKKIFREYNLPEDLVYVAMIESGFNPHAVSPKKAVGPWQFMRATAREYGLNSDHWVDERKDPVKSTRAAAAHFKDLYNTFGSWFMALASYNAGTGRMQGAALKARSDDFWELSASRFIQIETQEYVPRYMAALIIAKNPVAYGFTAPDTKSFEYDEVVVPSSTDLRRIAGFAGISYEAIKELNPELLQRATPQSRYVLRLPVGTKQTYQIRAAKQSIRDKKIRQEREQARSGGLLFSKLAEAPSPLPSRVAPVTVVSPYGAHLSFADNLSGLSGPVRK